MANDSAANVIRRLGDLSAKAFDQQMKVMRRYGELYQSFLRGEVKLDANNAAQFWVEESSRYLQGMAELNLNYYTALLDLGQTFADRLVKRGGPSKKTAIKPRRRATRKASAKRA
jgi:hypothetical protein